jgi:hypothetical protein
MKYENVKGILGLCTRDGQIRNQEQLKNTILEKKLSEYGMSQYDDPDGDYIWCVFFDGNLDDDIKDIVLWIMDNDENRFW